MEKIEKLIFEEKGYKNVEEKIEYDLKDLKIRENKKRQYIEELINNFENKISLEDPYMFIGTAQNALDQIKEEYSDLCKIRMKIDVLKSLKI